MGNLSWLSALQVASCDFFFFQAEDGIRDLTVTGVQTCALPISSSGRAQLLQQLLGRSQLPGLRALPGVGKRIVESHALFRVELVAGLCNRQLDLGTVWKSRRLVDNETTVADARLQAVHGLVCYARSGPRPTTGRECVPHLHRRRADTGPPAARSLRLDSPCSLVDGGHDAHR